MISAFDATMLILLFDPQAAAPADKATGKAVDHCQERLTYLLERTAKDKGSRLIFPIPALAEFLVRVDPGKVSEYISQVQRLRGAVVAPFDIRAAVDFAEMLSPDKRQGVLPLDAPEAADHSAGEADEQPLRRT